MEGKNDLGFLFSICDGDKKHFQRFYSELERLDYPFAVNFDHCSQETKELFKSHKNYLGGFDNDDPTSFFNEAHRQNALNILIRNGFRRVFSLDVDETLEKDAPEKIKEMLKIDADIIVAKVLDLWGDGNHYRVDGPFASSFREKMFKIERNYVMYYSPTIHAPRVIPKGRDVVIARFDIRVLHWGIMDMDDVKEHTERWNKIYTKAVGGNPYEFYPYLNDPTTIPILKEVEP